MNAIRDVFHLLSILCVLCLQFDLVEAPKRVENWQSDNTIALKESANKSDSEKLPNQHKFSSGSKKINPSEDLKKTNTDKSSPVERWFKPKKSYRRKRKHKSEMHQIGNKEWRVVAEKKIQSEIPKGRKSFRVATDWIPVYMRQEMRGTHEKKEKKDDDDDNDSQPDLLNIFSLREDVMTMLSSIPNINATVAVIGRTAEYNDIILCKISEMSLNKKNKSRKIKFRTSEKYLEEDVEKKIVFIAHGLSAMGFNEVPCLRQKNKFKKLLNIYAEHLDKFDIYLIPIANPDGVSDVTLELPNKNMSPQTACSGVALDRNFDISWNAFHVNSCHQQYPGPSPFSEPESRAVGDILHQFNNRIAAYINVHAASYSPVTFKGDAVLYPKGFVEFNSDDDKYMDMKGEIDEAIRSAGFKVTTVTVDSLYNWYGKVTGTSVDYASSVYGIPYAMEFVMQPYYDDPQIDSPESVSDNVLTEVWKRVIDVVFTNIYRSNQNNEITK